MKSWPAIWWVGLVVAAALVVLAVYTMLVRSRREVRHDRDEQVWKRAYHLAAELSAGRNVEANTAAVIELVADTQQPVLVATGMAVAVREEDESVDEALFRAVNRSALAARLRAAMQAGEVNSRVEVLELVEVLRLDDLFADAAVATRDPDAAVVRAACDAMVRLHPAAGLAVLLGIAGRQESWVIDSIGRASTRLQRDGRAPIPLARDKWRAAPLLAQRAIKESAMFDTATVSDAITALIGALDSPSAAVRLAAVSSLAGTIDGHPSAQLALAGALGSTDRMIRFATAAALSDTVAGQAILRSTAATGDGSDAARIAAEILWSHDPLGPATAAVAS